MKVLGINGSPRIGGNTDIILDKVLEGASTAGSTIEKVGLNTLKFVPCQECSQAPDDGICIINDDLQSVYLKIAQSDAIVLASPIFFGSVSAQTKMMIDRYQCLWRAKYLLKKEPGTKRKAGIFISVEASHRQDFFANARSIVKNFFATINADYTKELLVGGVAEKGSILKHPEVLQRAFNLGRELFS
ncbi:MAG: flavodoxin family protein [Candidatus Omnitrophota bacterium]